MVRTFLIILGAASLFGQMPAGWKAVKEKGCQAGVPAEWEINQEAPSTGQTKDGKISVAVGSHDGATVKTLTAILQQALKADRVFENSPQKVFWVSKPVIVLKNKPAVVSYSVEIPRKGGTCTLQVGAQQGQAEDLIKKIAGTLTATP